MPRHCRRAALAALLIFVPAIAGAAIPQQERTALEAIYAALDGPNWRDRENWLGVAGSECTWNGVRCDASGSTVIELDVAWNNAKGVFPRQIGDLTNLEAFRANGSAITGPLPADIGRLTKLQILDLTGYYDNFGSVANEISGPLPREIGNLTSLRELYLAANELSGPIPDDIGRLTNLEKLDISNNPMSGPLPTAMMSLAKLRLLWLENTGLTGQIPAAMNLPALESLGLADNELTGPLPASIARSARLKEIYLDYNALSGPIPSEIAQLTELETLSLSANQFEGPFPSLGALSRLQVLGLRGNRLSGSIPASVGQLQELRVLSISNTDLSGPLPQELFTLRNLREFYSYGTRFTGNINDFGRIVTLRILDLSGGNQLRGPFGTELTRLPDLRELVLNGNLIGGTLPAEIGNLTSLRYLSLQASGMSGTIPDSLANLANLESLYLAENDFRGELSGPLVARLTKLRNLNLGSNSFGGAIPPEIFTLAELERLWLRGNELTGPMPPVAGSPKLVVLDVESNRLTALPGDLGSLTRLEELYAGDNELSGPVPAAVGELKALRRLGLSGNRFSGPIPDFIALPELLSLDVSRNRLTGRIPAAITTLTKVGSGSGLRIDRNALFTGDPAVRAFLDAKSAGWELTQTVAPGDIRVTAQRERSITLSWTPIPFRNGPGGYIIARAGAPSGPFEVLTTTPNKQTPTFIVDGLEPSRQHYFTITTVSYPEGRQKNVVASEPAAPVAASTTAGAPAPASVVVFTYPGEIRQRPGGSGATSYTIGNVGDLPASVSISSNDALFSQDPSSFTLDGGATRTITVTGKPQSAGAYAGEAVLTGSGVPAGLSVRIHLLVTEPPAGVVSAQPSANRVDVSARLTDEGGGTVDFTNLGTAELRGIVVSNVAWIIPPRELIVIPPKETRTVAFKVDASKRPDASSPAGAVTGTLSLVYESGAAGKTGGHSNHGSINLATPVTVVYTITPPVESASFPPLAPGEVALFIAGVGHVTGAKGLYISDVAIVNAFGIDSPSDIRMYYSPSDPSLPTKVTAVNQLQPSQGVTFGNVVQSVFDYGNLGTIQLRTRNLDQLFVNANIFNVTDRSGTYGTSLPIFRSDRALGPGESIFLTGLRRDAARTTYTNLFIQETSGSTAQYEFEFYDASGAPLGGKRSGSVSPYRLVIIGDSPDNPAVPIGAVAARMTNRGGGRIVGYATPLDAQSGDFWMVADWSRELGAALDEPVVIPVAGSLHGNLNTFYRTDVAITNRSAGAAGGSFVFFDRGGARREREVLLAAGESSVLNDIIGASFPELGDTFGYLQFEPDGGSFSVTSRTFATIPTLPGTFGTGVPALPRGAALRLGQSKIIAGLDVASMATIAGAKPGTFRTNVGLVEIAGQPATVQVTVVYNDIKQIVSGIRLTTITYELAPYQSVIDGIAARIQATNPSVSDLRSVQLKFQVTKGEGAVIVYTSSVDNGTADQVLRTQ